MKSPTAPDLQTGRLTPAQYAANFSDATPALTDAQARIEAERCLYCYDAPCASACPTAIDVPSFIRRIGDGNLRGAARTILEVNPLGGMCARVCPTENLCEAVCVRNTQEQRPVAIGRLQRHAVDHLMASPQAQPFTRLPDSGKRIAVVGAGPAGLACAHTLARNGHAVTLFDAHPKLGGLNEYGLARYKTPDDFAQREIAWLLSIGGITVQAPWKLESRAQLDALQADYDAIFLGLGLASTAQLGIAGEHLNGVQDAVEFIAQVRQATDLATVPVGRRVVVIGGGMTAIDAAVQARLLGASEVHCVYRRGPQAMSASRAEQEWALTHGVVLHHHLAPAEIQEAADFSGKACAVRFTEQTERDGGWSATGRSVTLAADMVLKAIGQTAGNPVLQSAGFALERGRLVTDSDGQTSRRGIWAGGDCRAGGLDLTVEAVAQGRAAALHMHATLLASPLIASA